MNQSVTATIIIANPAPPVTPPIIALVWLEFPATLIKPSIRKSRPKILLHNDQDYKLTN